MAKDTGFADGKIVQRFDCYEGTSAKAKLSKDLYVEGVNFFAQKPGLPDKLCATEAENAQASQNAEGARRG